MKKYIAILLVLVMVLGLAACTKTDNGGTTPTPTPTPTPTVTPTPDNSEEPPADEKTVMTYAEYIAAPLESEVTIEAYVQGHQSWWDNKITVYAQDEDGAYFLYEMACSEEDAAKLTTGTKIRVTGFKGEWAGEVEIMDATFEFIDGNYVAAPVDATAWLGTDELIKHQNEFVSFKGMTVEAIEYKNGEPGDDIYVTLGSNGASYSFCVEVYLTGTETEVYTTVGTLAVGDVVDVEGFLYWYEGPNPHITSIKAAAAAETAKGEGVMTYAEYIAADMDTQVVIEAYVQAHQSWWDNKITVYAQDEDGAYFLYEMACSEEDAAKLVPGTKIKVTGYKGEWAGEVEIMDATFEFLEGSYIAAPVDATAWLGTDELIKHQNEFVSFKGMTVEAIEYKNGEPGDDIYVTLGSNGASYDFCVEVYLTGTDTEVYTTVGTLAVGDVVDVEGFLYWYEGPNPHITSITKTGTAASTEPETPAEPEVSAEPETPAEPEVSAEPETPAEPEVSAEPETPAEPEVSAEPETPAEPEVSAEPAAPTNVAYISVSVDGKLLVAAQPVEVASGDTADTVLKKAHALYCAEGEAGFTSGIDSMYNMYMISEIWGVPQTPCVIVNGQPIGADISKPTTADAYTIAAGDNIVVAVSSDPMSIPALYVSLATDGTTVKATLWVLDFMTFQYNSSALAGATVVDPTTGASLGTTDANGKITVSGVSVVAIDGWAAIPVNVTTNSTDIG